MECGRHRVTWMVMVALLMVSVAGCGGGSAATRSSAAPPPSPASSTVASSSAGTVAGPASRIAVIVLENREYNEIIGRPAAPYLNALARQSAVAANYHAITHPSLPNYLALTGGSTFGYSGSDCGTCSVSHRNLIDQLEAAHISWKVYAEDLPSACSSAASAGAYVRRHDPFMYYRDVADNPARCRSDRAHDHADKRSRRPFTSQVRVAGSQYLSRHALVRHVHERSLPARDRAAAAGPARAVWPAVRDLRRGGDELRVLRGGRGRPHSHLGRRPGRASRESGRWHRTTITRCFARSRISGDSRDSAVPRCLLRSR